MGLSLPNPCNTVPISTVSRVCMGILVPNIRSGEWSYDLVDSLTTLLDYTIQTTTTIAPPTAAMSNCSWGGNGEQRNWGRRQSGAGTTAKMTMTTKTTTAKTTMTTKTTTTHTTPITTATSSCLRGGWDRTGWRDDRMTKRQDDETGKPNGGGPKRRRLGPRYVSFLFSSFYALTISFQDLNYSPTPLPANETHCHEPLLVECWFPIPPPTRRHHTCEQLLMGWTFYEELTRHNPMPAPP